MILLKGKLKISYDEIFFLFESKMLSLFLFFSLICIYNDVTAGAVCTSPSISYITLMVIFMAKSQMHKWTNPSEIQNKPFVSTNDRKLHPDNIRFFKEYHLGNTDWVVSSKHWHFIFDD